MLRYFGTAQCPSCEIYMERHFYDDAGCRIVPGAASTGDQRWACPSCDFTRPVIYEVERGNVRHSGLLSRFRRSSVGNLGTSRSY